jgi:hypothetical protein
MLGEVAEYVRVYFADLPVDIDLDARLWRLRENSNGDKQQDGRPARTNQQSHTRSPH